MSAFIAWLIASPIGVALIGAIETMVISKLTAKITQLETDLANHKTAINEISQNFRKLIEANDESTADELNDAIDQALARL